MKRIESLTKRIAAMLLLVAGFWMLGIIACPRQTQLTKTRDETNASSAMMAVLLTAGFYLLTANNVRKGVPDRTST